MSNACSATTPQATLETAIAPEQAADLQDFMVDSENTYIKLDFKVGQLAVSLINDEAGVERTKVFDAGPQFELYKQQHEEWGKRADAMSDVGPAVAREQASDAESFIHDNCRNAFPIFDFTENQVIITMVHNTSGEETTKKFDAGPNFEAFKQLHQQCDQC